MDKMEELYSELHHDVEKYFKEDSLCTLVPMKGDQYDTESKKLMLVGRATNGWFEMKKDYTGKCTQYIKEATELIEKKNRFQWIEDAKKNQEKPYYTEAKPFWNYTRCIWEKLQERERQFGWYQSILWSNIFPVSFSAERNPSNKLKYAQFHSAKKLLQAQINSFQPTYVLIITDWNNWFALEKRPRYHFEADEKFLPLCERKDDNDVIKSSGVFDNSLVVVSRRPEFFCKETFVECVVSEFKYLEETMPIKTI